MLLEGAVLAIVVGAEVVEDGKVLDHESGTMAAAGKTLATLSILPLQRFMGPCFLTTVERSAKNSW